jgi:hypothetical protein
MIYATYRLSRTLAAKGLSLEMWGAFPLRGSNVKTEKHD